MIARESARILIEEGIDDFQLAKQKAAKRLGYGTTDLLPGNEEIERAIGQYHRLFRSGLQHAHIKKLRCAALEAMLFLKSFSPRLVGNVVDGSAGQHSPVVIYLNTESPEPVIIAFLNADIPFVESSRRRLITGRTVNYPTIEFVIDDIRIETHILTEIPFREYFQNRKLSGPYATIDSIRKILDNECRSPDD